MSSKTPVQAQSGHSTPSDESKINIPEDDIAQIAPILAQPATTLVTGAPLRTDSVLGNWTLTVLGIRKKSEPPYDLDAIATRESLWDNANVDELKEKFISPDWENLEAFDPNFRWTYREEREVRRIVDWKIMAWVCVMFAALNIDRGNINNAVSDNMLDDLNLTQADYNLGRTLSRLGFLLAELPSQLISKRLGPDIWLPMQMVIFSAISASQFWLSGRASFLACRYLLATFQGGVIPDTILYLSYYYPSAALPIRLAWYWTSSNLVEIGVGFWAVGLLKMRGVLGYAGWRWLFLIEGLVTMVIGILSFGLMPMSPVKNKTWFVKKGYFTPRQAKIIVNSVIRDDPAKGGMHNRQALNFKDIWQCIKDYDMWPIYILGLLFGIPAGPIGQYLTLSFRGLGFNVTQTNLLTIPSTVFGAITMLGITAISELVNNRSFVAMAEDAWLVPCFIALIVLPDPIHPWAYFAIATILLSYPYTHAIQVAWTSRNSGSVRNRTCSAALYNMMVQLSGIVSANIYQKSDAPRYHKANRALVAIAVWMCAVQYPATFFYYKWRNKRKAAKWDVMTPQEKEAYLQTTTDEGNKRLDFRFAA